MNMFYINLYIGVSLIALLLKLNLKLHEYVLYKFIHWCFIGILSLVENLQNSTYHYEKLCKACKFINEPKLTL